MFDATQKITYPYGVTVFGSSVIRVVPDIASLKFSVSRIHKAPKNAFESARKDAKVVREYLAKANITDVGTSRIKLSQQFEHLNRGREFVGYVASVGFHATISDLDQVEQVLVGVIGAGANELDEVVFQSTSLQAHRAEARRRAVAAARLKAENYCEAAGGCVGEVLHLEDVNPEALSGRHAGHVRTELPPDDDENACAIDPGAIVIGGAVLVSFSIKSA